MSKKVMIVDDSKTARREIVRLVHNLGLMAFEAENGRYGLELVRNRTDIGLIFCDINMPEMNGLEFLEALRKEANHKDTPVIMLTSEAAEDVLNKAKEFGIKGWILKPAQPNSVKSLLEKFCA
ncbi:MAG TPA: response regulator [Oligoflexus sp.]|jgi:two-component system chemotaxis response regulator CheY|uniref:response regulator n=1 Tax=Oligoflexus sp. TaxID=1971216 RepID=UPI002D7EC258|nr:response regulator [Oligoflexus sp.]HET9239732.1 response regulator [Oligoflexus sp.]